MNIDRAIEILTPDVTRYTPQEYEEALRMSRDALKLAKDDAYMTMMVEDEEG